MKIEIQNRQHPFSHVPGCYFILPRSSWQVQVFPTKAFFSDLSGKEEGFFVDIKVKGPHKDFTVVQNLDKNVLQVFSHGKEGYFRYRIEMVENGIRFLSERPQEIAMVIPLKGEILCNQEGIILPKKGYFPQACEEEILSLGENKKLDWTSVQTRKQLSEILPIWFRLSQRVPKVDLDKTKGTAVLLGECEALVKEGKNTQVAAASMNFFETAFQGVLTPRSHDFAFLGTLESGADFPPISLLSDSYQWIRDMFFQEKDKVLRFLPCIPQEFHTGRMINVRSSDGDVIDFEWSKKQIRRVKIKVAKEKRVVFSFPSAITSYRLRTSPRQKGREIKKGEPVFFEKGQTLFLDCFQK